MCTRYCVLVLCNVMFVEHITRHELLAYMGTEHSQNTIVTMGKIVRIGEI